MKHTSENITRIVLYSISADKALLPKSYTLDLKKKKKDHTHIQVFKPTCKSHGPVNLEAVLLPARATLTLADL